MIFIETSVLVAAFQDFHTNHERSFALIASARRRSASTSVHCVTELFSVVTRMPPKFRASTELGLRFVHQTQRLLTIRDLDVQQTVEVIEELASRGIGGGLVYDALIIACARQNRLTAFYTLNKRHFDAIAPELAHIIREP